MDGWRRVPSRRDLEDYLRRRVAEQTLRTRDDQVVPTPVDPPEEATTGSDESATLGG